ncbi:MAG TPA: thiamine pyrophosphate-dependent enzyme [Amycolatopsis sp.]|nr:thiamine pyrophosphate-dependent enzyme [Amycolatopsis sp.]
MTIGSSVDAHYPVAVGVEGDPAQALDELAAALPDRLTHDSGSSKNIRTLLDTELRHRRHSDAFPLVPRVVTDVRTALDRHDIVLADTGAGKMWMAHLYPTYEPDTCLISNGLSTMGFASPAAIAAKLARTWRRHARTHPAGIPRPGGRGIRPDHLENGTRTRPPQPHPVHQPGPGRVRRKLRRCGYAIENADQLLPVLRRALDDDTGSVISCPVDYSEKLRLTDRPGSLHGPF